MAIVYRDDFSVSVGRALGRVVLTLHGALDAAVAPRLRSTLTDLIEQQGNLDVIVDLSHLEFIDSRGVGVLLDGADMARKTGGNLTLGRPRPGVQRVLELVGVSQQFTFARVESP